MKKIFSIYLLLCSLVANAAIEKTIYVSVGGSFAVQPWNDVKSNFPGYTCRSTSLVLSNNSAFSVSEYSRTTTRYPGYSTGIYHNGFYCSYKVEALAVGNYTITGIVDCVKKTGTTIYDGGTSVIYHVIVEPRKTVTSISIPSHLNLEINDTYTFSPIIYETGAYTTLTWSSSKPSVASINSDGAITALSEGTSIITCTASNGVSAQCVVTVTKPYVKVESLILNETNVSITEGEVYTLVASVLPQNATNQTISWLSSDESVVKVVNGVIIGVKKGNCSIICSCEDKVTTCSVEVVQKNIKVSNITLNQTSATLKASETITLYATILPETATIKDVTWESSDESVATVENGIVIAHKVGTVNITATTTDGTNLSATCQVEVVSTPAESITLNQTSATLKASETITLYATILPETATIKDVTWESSDESVATVENGIVIAHKVGTVNITATTTDGTNLSATCQINSLSSIINIQSDSEEAAYYTINGLKIDENKLQKGIYIKRQGSHIIKIIVK